MSDNDHNHLGQTWTGSNNSLKIDGSFVRNLIAEPTNKVFIDSLVDIARTFKLETVAEWVGDAETAQLMTDAGITYMQGFHFGKPFLADQGPAAQASAGSGVI